MNNIKSFFLVILLFAVTTELLSYPVDVETAKMAAQNFASRSRGVSKMASDVVTEQFEGQNSFYVVNFREGGWVMVSADNSTVPIFAYSQEGAYRIEDEKPAAFLGLVEGYKEQVDVSRKMGLPRSSEIIEKWNALMIDENRSNITSLNSTTPNTRTYTPNTQLLNIPGRGQNLWDQFGNNGGADSCNPTYNKYADPKAWWMGVLDKCECDDRTPAGCAAVAMGQVMWYWQWPKSSSYRTYNWDLMPNAIFTGDIAQGDAIARLLRDCGDAVNMTYMCSGSFATMNNVEDALRNTFNFKAARKVTKNEWNSQAWLDLIRTEIDCERPVIYRGDNCNICNPFNEDDDIGDRHIFVVDGYDATDPDLFWINFGWGSNNNSYNISTHYLNDITPGSHEFNKNQSAIIGISPTYYSPSSVNVTDVSYTTVTGNRVEEAQQNITLPAPGKTLTVESGGSLTLIAGNSITLNPGFHAKPGSQLITRIEPTYAFDTEITVPSWPNAFAPSFGSLQIWVNNANSFEITVIASVGGGNALVYQGAGFISDNIADLWDGTNNSGSGAMQGGYVYRVKLRNNFGRIMDVEKVVSLLRSGGGSDTTKIENYDYRTRDYILENELITDADIVVFPNPNSGTVNIEITKTFNSYNLRIYNINGALIGENRNITQPTYSFDMSGFTDGMYILQFEIDNQIVSKRIILAK